MIKERKRIITEQIIDNTIPDNRALDTYSNRHWLVRYLVEPSAGLLILRLLLGGVFIMHGGQKVLGWFGGNGLEGTAQFMGQMGIPAMLANAASFVEFFGGIALVLGLLTRFAALGIMGVMAVAIAMVHLDKGFFAPQGYEFPLTLGVIALVLFLLGPGRFSLDEAMTRRAGRRDDINIRRSV